MRRNRKLYFHYKRVKRVDRLFFEFHKTRFRPPSILIIIIIVIITIFYDNNTFSNEYFNNKILLSVYLAFAPSSYTTPEICFISTLVLLTVAQCGRRVWFLCYYNGSRSAIRFTNIIITYISRYTRNTNNIIKYLIITYT